MLSFKPQIIKLLANIIVKHDKLLICKEITGDIIYFPLFLLFF